MYETKPPADERRDDRQWRFVFTTPADEASMFSLVNPRPVSASSESVDPENNSIRVNDYYQINDSVQDWPEGAPHVSVQIDQRSGQVNVRVAPHYTQESHPVARSPAHMRKASSGLASGEVVPAATRLPAVVRPLPPESNTRAIAPSPAGIAIRTPGGVDFVPAGSIRTPAGTIWTPKGSSYSPGGTAYWAIGTKDTADGMLTPSGTLYMGNGIGYGPSGHVYTPGGTTYSPSGMAYSSWAGSFPFEPNSSSAIPSNFISPLGSDQAPILAAQHSLGDTLIGNAGAPELRVSSPLGGANEQLQLTHQTSDHPPTPYHSHSPLQIQSPAVRGMVPQPIFAASPASSTQSPNPFFPQTLHTTESPISAPIPISPGPSPHELELRAQDVIITTAIHGPDVQTRKVQRSGPEYASPSPYRPSPINSPGLFSINPSNPPRTPVSSG